MVWLGPWFFALALYGPLGLILAAVMLVRMSRAEGTALAAVVGWIVVGLSMAGTAVFHWILIWSVPLV